MPKPVTGHTVQRPALLRVQTTEYPVPVITLSDRAVKAFTCYRATRTNRTSERSVTREPAFSVLNRVGERPP